MICYYLRNVRTYTNDYTIQMTQHMNADVGCGVKTYNER